jgi:hypothetical protein
MSQSIVSGEASGAMEYCQAPMAEFRLVEASTMFSSPMAPDRYNSRALA